MPGPTPLPVASDDALPPRTEVVVIGGGIIGVSTALELAERGHQVLLCEKGEIAGEQSSRNWGWVRLACRDPREIPLMIEAVRLWEGMEARVGSDVGYRQSGILFSAETDALMASYATWAEHLEPHQVRAALLGPSDLKDHLPADTTTALRGALSVPKDGRAEPQWAAPRMAEAARRAGAVIRTGCAVRAVDTQAGRISGVVTEDGPVQCEAVVLAGGAWSRLFAGNAGIDLPQLKVMNTVLRTSPVEGGPEAAVWADAFAIRKRADGGYSIASGHENTVDLVPDSFRLARRFLPAYAAQWKSLRFRLSDRWRTEARTARRWSGEEITPFETCRVLDPVPSARVVRKSWAAAQAAFPALNAARVEQSWAGMIDVTPDAIPVMSEVDGVGGFFIATGFSGHGFGIGPGAGRLMADLVTGQAPVVDPEPFRLSRFFDGSPTELLAGF